MLTDRQLNFWDENRYIKVPGFYSFPKVLELQKWVSEISNYPSEKGKWMLYYETSLFENKKILCRIENFFDYHDKLNHLLTDKNLLSIIQILLGEYPVLFKEKINFKFPGGNGFAAHQDAPAYAMFRHSYHVTAMISIDASTEKNGCLEFVQNYAKKEILPQENGGDLSREIVGQFIWLPITTNPGDLLIFDSYVPHRSGPNLSDKSRRVLFATYNKRSESYRRTEYFSEKRKYFPPENERDPNIDYHLNNPFNLGNPIK